MFWGRMRWNDQLFLEHLRRWNVLMNVIVRRSRLIWHQCLMCLKAQDGGLMVIMSAESHDGRPEISSRHVCVHTRTRETFLRLFNKPVTRARACVASLTRVILSLSSCVIHHSSILLYTELSLLLKSNATRHIITRGTRREQFIQRRMFDISVFLTQILPRVLRNWPGGLQRACADLQHHNNWESLTPIELCLQTP